jgi:dUTP pyrophosphatase
MVNLSSCLDNYIKTGVWKEMEKAFGEELRVVYLDNYKLDEWGPLTYDPENLCFDLRVASTKNIYCYPRTVTTVGLGVKFDLPPNIGLNLYARSSLCKSGLLLANGTGKIDPAYRGELLAPVVNVGNNECVIIRPGERIVQAEIVYRKPVFFKQIDERQISETKRGDGGFGHTGRF